ncbi:MAG: hypothetical protein IK109_03165 [Clostridiales bacterium]|nr:hypothetical protein [Clostridiales bacterium]MBR5417016.1 hypothetical protein [Clostridiales bacterium]
MKRDIIGDIFLGGVLLSLLFLFSFPAYFCYTANVPRDISLAERVMSVCFVLGVTLTIIWSCWKKKVWVMLGICAFGLLAYMPKWFLPKVDARIAKNGKNLLDSFFSMILSRIHELVHAPFTGLLGMMSEKTVEKLPYLILPIAAIAYICSQIVVFYHDAYVKEKKQIHDFNHFRKTSEIRTPAMAFDVPEEAPSPLGTIVLNEKAEIEKETFPVKPQDNAQTVTNVLSSEDTEKLPAGDATAVIPLAAHAPSSKDETQVIALAAHAPTSKDDTQVIALAAHAPTSAADITKEDEHLDFPDVHGEAEKIDVFGDSDLD